MTEVTMTERTFGPCAGCRDGIAILRECRLCGSCYQRWYRAGQPCNERGEAVVPTPYERHRARYARYLRISRDAPRLGTTKIAEIMQVTPRTVLRYRARQRAGEVIDA